MLRPLALAAAVVAGAPAALALPQGEQLRFGQARVQATSPQRLDIRQTTRQAGLDWTSFSIAAGEQVVISQPGRDAVLVNRVTGNDSSRLFGQLQSNGSVWLVNPRGIVFGRDSQVDVGGLLATTLSIRNEDLTSGRLLLSRLPGDGGAIQADGRIRAADGSVVLVAPSLGQGGRIDARRIGLAAATEVQVDVEGDGLIFFNARNDGSLAARLQQLGTLRADGGTAELRAAGRAGFADTVLNLDGVVQARSIGRRAGRILIDGGDSGLTRVAGTVDASGRADGERGGEITVLGEQLALTGTAVVDASGPAGGGALRIGGDLQGRQADVFPPAQQLLVQPGARLDASALHHGDGGLLVLWSQGTTVFAGAADARGGRLGGDGGLVEVSGRGSLQFLGQSDRAAPAGRAGTLLLDPLDLEIVASGSAATVPGDGQGGFRLPSTAQPTTSQITAATLTGLLATGPVELQAARDIRVLANAPVDASASGKALTLKAGNNVVVAAAITNKGSLTLSASTPNLSYTSPTNVTTTSTLAGKVVMTANLGSAEGTVTLTNNAGVQASTGVHELGGQISAGSLVVTGDVTIPTALTLALTGNGTTTLSSTIGGAGSLTKAGADSTLVLTRANAYTGGTTVSGGTLAISGAGADAGSGTLTLGASTLDIRGGATPGNPVSIDGGIVTSSAGGGRLDGAVTLGAGGATVDLANPLELRGTVSGAGVLRKTGAGELLLSNSGNSHQGGTAVGGGVLSVAADGALGDAGGGLTLDGGTLKLTAPTAVATSRALTLGAGGGTVEVGVGLALGGVVSGTGALTKTGVGELVLTRANGYNGGTTVSAGTLAVSGVGADAGSGTLTLGASTLDIRNGATPGHAVTIDGGTVTSSAGGGRLDGAVTLGAGGGTFDLANALELRGAVSGPGELRKAGAAALVLSSANGYSGGTTVSGGTLAISGAGADAGSGAVALGAHALDIRDGATPANALTVDGGTVTSSAGGGRLDGAVTLAAGGATFDLANTIELRGAVSGAGALAKTGAGDLVLSNSGNSHQGGTAVGGGVLSVAADGALGDAGGGLTLDGGTLKLTAPAAVATGRAVTLGAGGGTVEVGVRLSLGGVVSGAGALTKTGAGELVLTRANGYSGGTTVSAGTLAISGVGADAGSGTVTLGANALDIRDGATPGHAVTIDGGTLTSTAGGGRLDGAVTLGAGGATVDLAHPLELRGAVSGTGGLRKAGTATLLLSSANGYSGGTTVSGGTLAISGVGADAGSGTVALGANALDIRGGATPANAVTVDGGTVTSSAGGGRLDGAVTLGAGGATVDLVNPLELRGTVSGTGGLRKAGTAELLLSSANAYSGGTTVSAGTLAISGLAADAGSGTIALGSNALDIRHGATVHNLVTVDSGATIRSSVGGGTLSNLQPLTLAAAPGTLRLAGGAVDALVVDRDLDGANGANGAVEVIGGQVTLTGFNTQRSTAVTGGARLSVPGLVSLGGGGLTLDEGTLALTAPTPVVTGRAVTLGPGGGTFDVGIGLELGGVLSGAGALTKAGAGELVLSNNGNSHQGGTTVSGGVLSVAADAALGAADGALTLDGGTLKLTALAPVAIGRAVTLLAGGGSVDVAGALELGGAVSGAGALIKAGAGELVLTRANGYRGGTTVSGGTLAIRGVGADAGSGTLVLGPNTLDIRDGAAPATPLTVDGGTVTSSAGGGRLDGAVRLQAGGATFDLANPLEVRGIVSGVGALRKTGAGDLVLTRNNAYSGGTTVGGGTLALSGAASDAGPGTVELGSHTLDLRNGASPDHPVVIDGGTVTSSVGGGRLDGAVTLGAGGATADAAQAIELRGVVSGTGGLRKTGAAELLLSSANAYSGGTTVSAGTLAISGLAADAGSGTIALGSNALDIRHGATVHNLVTVDSGATIRSSVGGGTLSNLQPLALAAGQGTLKLAGGAVDALVVDRDLDGANGANGLLEITAGQVTLTGFNTQRSTAVTGGARLSVPGAAPLGSGVLTLDDGTLALTTPLFVVTGRAVTLGAGGGTVEVDAGLELGGVVSGPGALTKTGAGELVLSRNNRHGGGTTVGAGRLTLSGVGADAGSGTIVLGAQALDIRHGAAPANAVTIDGGTVTSSAGGGRLDGAVTLGAGGATVDLANPLELRGVVSGTGALRKAGAAELLLSRDNGYGGGTVVSGGTLAISGAGADAGSGTIALGAHRLDIRHGAAPGNLVTVDGGTLTSSAGGGQLDGAVSVSAGGVTVDAAQAITLRGVVSGTGPLHKTGAAELLLTADNTYSGGTTVAAGTLALGGAGADAGSGTVGLGANRLDLRNGAAPGHAVTADGGTLTSSVGGGRLDGALGLAAGGLTVDAANAIELRGVVSGSGALHKTGAAELLLASANAYSGGTTVSGGTLALGGAGADAGIGMVVLGSNTLDVRNGATPAHPLTVDGGTVTSSAGGGRLDGAVTLGAGGVTVDTAHAIALRGVVSGPGALRKTGAAELLLARDNAYAGGTTVSAGTLALAGAGTDAGSGTLALGANTLDLRDGATPFHALTIDGGSVVSSAGGGRLDGPVTLLAGGGSFDLAHPVELRGVVSGPGELRKAGAAALVLANDNSHGGGTTVSGGTLAIRGAGADAGSGTIALGANRLDILDGAAVASRLTVADGAVVTNSRGTGTLAFHAAPVALAADTRLTLSSSGDGLLVDRAISAAPADAASARLLVSRSGQGSGVTLARAASHGGGTVVDAGGRLAIGSAAALGAGTLTLDGGTLASTAAFTTTRPVVLGAQGGTVDTGGGDIGLAGVVSGGALTKAGTGMLLLSAANTYSGGTRVDAGVLAIDAAGVAGANAGVGPITVGNRTLDLRNGALLAADLALDGGTLANSAGSGRLDGRLTLRGASTLSSIGSGLTLNGVIDEAAAGTGLTTQGPITLTAAGTYTGDTTIAGGTLTLGGAQARAGLGRLLVGAQRLVLDQGASVATAVHLDAGGTLANTAGSGTITEAGSLQLAGTARLQAGGDGLTLRGAVVEAPGAPVSGLVIEGGTVTLQAAGSYRGDTVVDSGTLVLRGAAAAPGLGNLRLGAQVLDLADGASLANPLQLADGATLRNSSGTGTLASAGGPVALAAGATLHLDSGGSGLVIDRRLDDAGGRATLDITGAAGLVRLAQPNALDGTLQVRGGATLVAGVAGALGTAALQLDAGTLRAGSALANALQVGAGGGTLDVDAAGIAFSGVISGGGTLAKRGSGTLTLLADNSHSGTIRLDDGLLAVSGPAADAGSGRLDVGSQVLDLRDGARLVQAVTLGPGGVLRSSAGDGTLAAGGSLQLQGDARLEAGVGSTLTVQAPLTDTTPAALTTAGGTVVLAAAASHRNGTRVASGTLRLDGPAASAGSGPIDVGAATLDLAHGAVVPNPVTLAGGALRNSAGSGTLGGTLQLDGGGWLGSSGDGLRITGAVSGTGGLTADGGHVSLAHVGNRFDGPVAVSAGSLRLEGGDALPDAATVTLAGSGRLVLADAETIGALAGSAGTAVLLGNATLTAGGNQADSRFDGVLQGDGSLVKRGSGRLTLGGDNQHLGPTRVQAGVLALAGADERLSDAGQLLVEGGMVDLGGRRETVAGVLLDGGAIVNGTLVSATTFDLRQGSASAVLDGVDAGVGLRKTGAGSLTLAGANLYTGTTTLAEGTLLLVGGGRLAAGSRLVVDGGLLDLGGATESVAGVRLGAGTIAHGSLVSASSFDLSGGSVSASLGGATDGVGLDKTDADRTLTLSGANTYRGDTRLHAGRLVLAGGADVLHDTGTLQVRGGTLDIGDHSETVGLLSLQGGRITGSSGVLRSLQPADLRSGELAAILGGSAGAFKLGEGSVTLSAANLDEGLLRVEAGTVVLAAAQRLSARSTLQVGPAATVRLAGDQTLAGLQLDGTLDGTGTLRVPVAELDGGTLQVPLVATSLGSRGSSRLAAEARAATLTVRSGQLQLAAPELLADDGRVVVEAPATLALAGAETVGQLQLQGTLAGPGTLTAASYALQGGRALAALGPGLLTSSGSSLLDAEAQAGRLAVQSGVLTTGPSARLVNLPSVDVAAGAQWLLQAPQRIGSLAGAGLVQLGTHTLRTGAGGDSRFDGVLDSTPGSAASLVKQGDGRFTLGGASTHGGETVVEAGTLALAGADRLADAGRLQVAAGATLALDADDTVAALHLAGTLAGRGRLTAAQVRLQSGRTEAALGPGALQSEGDSTIAGPAAVDRIEVTAGRLTLAAPAGLDSAPATAVAAGATLALQGDTTLGSLAGAGTVALGRFTLTTGGGGDSRFDGVLAGDGGQLHKVGDSRFTLGGSQRATGGTTVRAGTLALDGADRLGAAGALVVDAGAVLALAGDNPAASLALRGTLTGSGALNAATVLLDGGTARADLGPGVLTVRGSSTLASRTAADTVQVESGRLRLEGSDRLADRAAVHVAAGATLTLDGSDRIDSLQLAGTLDGRGTLSTTQAQLLGSTVGADLAGGTLDSRGASRIDGTAAFDRIQVHDGRLVLGGAGRLLADPVLRIEPGAVLALGGDETLGSLAGAGRVALGGFTLRTGAAGSSSFAGVIEGDGGLVKLGADTTFGLTGANTYRGSTWVAAGVLAVGDGDRAGAIDATRDIRVDGTLQFDRADTVRLPQPVDGAGGITQAGRGTLILSDGAKTYRGPTTVRSGLLVGSGDEALSNASAVQVDAAAALQLPDVETIGALQADGAVSLGRRLTADGALVFNGAATVRDGGPLRLQAGAVDAPNAANAWGSRLSLDVGGAVQLAAGATRADGVPGALTLGEVQIGGGGRIEATRLLLDGATRLRGGRLVLDLRGGRVLLEPGAELLGRVTPTGRPLAFSDDLLRQTPATAQNPVALEVDPGAQLDVQTANGGSVALLNPANRVDGGLSVVTGSATAPWRDNPARAGGPGGAEVAVQDRVRLNGGTLHIAGDGLVADVVVLQADALATLDAATITARLPYDNQAGTAKSVPGLTFVLRDPGAFVDPGGDSTTSFGSGVAPLRIDVGSLGIGNRTDLATNAGYVTVQPTVRLGGMGRTAVFLQGPLTATGYSFFYDGARRQGTVPVFYNGESAVPPQVSGSISSTLSVSEGARKERFDEAVRTENVALRLRAGVIAEVGPGRPATEQTAPMDGLRPPACAPAPGTLACAP